jgi:hypothetical protein
MDGEPAEERISNMPLQKNEKALEITYLRLNQLDSSLNLARTQAPGANVHFLWRSV